MDETTTLRTVESIARMEARIAELTAERDAALAAVDAVRADYAPRHEPPTAEELDAVEADDGGWLAMPDDTWNLYFTDLARKLAAWHRAHPEVDCAWRCVEAGNIPRPWSELAALVARGGDRG